MYLHLWLSQTKQESRTFSSQHHQELWGLLWVAPAWLRIGGACFCLENNASLSQTGGKPGTVNGRGVCGGGLGGGIRH